MSKALLTMVVSGVLLGEMTLAMMLVSIISEPFVFLFIPPWVGALAATFILRGVKGRTYPVQWIIALVSVFIGGWVVLLLLGSLFVVIYAAGVSLLPVVIPAVLAIVLVAATAVEVRHRRRLAVDSE